MTGSGTADFACFHRFGSVGCQRVPDLGLGNSKLSRNSCWRDARVESGSLLNGLSFVFLLQAPVLAARRLAMCWCWLEGDGRVVGLNLAARTRHLIDDMIGAGRTFAPGPKKRCPANGGTFGGAITGCDVSWCRWGDAGIGNNIYNSAQGCPNIVAPQPPRF